MGVSILLPKGAPTLDVTVEWGDYIYEGQTEQGAEPAEEAAPIEDAKAKAEKEKTKKFKGYRREPRSELVTLPIPRPGEKGNSKVPNSRGLELVVTVRQVTKISTEVLPAGSLAVSVFLVNNRAFDEGFAYKATAFQTTLIVDSATPFLGRPNPRGTVTNPMEEWDEAVADLQFRDAFEFSVGHGVATLPLIEERVCRRVKTTWIPQAEVERVAPTPMVGVELRLEELGKLPDGPTAKAKLEPMIASYLAWIEAQEKKTAKLTLNKTQRETAAHLLSTAGDAARRIEKGIATLQMLNILEHFDLAGAGFQSATSIHLQAEAFGASLAERLWAGKGGAAFFLDSGFPEGEYFHPQRHMGTVMCHQLHQADPDPLVAVGQKDITAHVNFTGVALAAQNAGLHVLGYASQAWFLLNLGLAEGMAASSLAERSQAQRLVNEHEMGELFKVVGLTTSTDWAAQGFVRGDRSHRL